MRIDGGGSSIPLESFRQVSGQDGQVGIVQGQDGNPRVIATGRSSEGREVSWVRPEGPGSLESDVVSRFLDAISGEFGPRITRNIARELGLGSVSGSLDTRTVERAMQMAESQREVFSGANFFIELHCSAKAGGAGFHAALERLGGPPLESLDDGARQDIDERFRAALAAASQGNQEPLSPADGERLLQQVLQQWLGERSGA